MPLTDTSGVQFSRFEYVLVKLPDFSADCRANAGTIQQALITKNKDGLCLE